MLKLDYIVRVFVGGSDVVPEIGLSGGVCTWETANQVLGVLTENWTSAIPTRVDISAHGNYTQYSGVTVSIVGTKLVETTLNNIGLNLTGSRIEIAEFDGSVEITLFRGVVGKPMPSGNNVALKCSHVANYYNANMAPAVGGEYAPIVFGESVNRVKLRLVEGGTDEPTLIGDELLPVFSVVYQFADYIMLLSVYPDTLVDEDAINDFVAAHTYLKLVSSSELIVNTAVGGRITRVVGGKTYHGFKSSFVPLNERNTSGDYVIPNDENVSVEGVEFDKVYVPYGSDVDFDNLQFEDNGKYITFPSYVDSRVDYDDRVEILDADESGEGYIPPTGFAGLDDGSAPIADIGLTGFVFESDGVYLKNATASNIVVTNSSLMADRNSAFLEGEYDADSTGSGEFAWVTKYPFTLKNGIPDDLYLTLYNAFVWSWSPDEIGTALELKREIYLQTIRAVYTIKQDSKVFIADSGGGGFAETSDINLLPIAPGSNIENEVYRLDNTTFQGWGTIGKGIELLGSVVEEYELSAPMTVYVVTSFDTGAVVINQHFEYNAKQFIAGAYSYDTDQLYMSSVGGRKSRSGDPVDNTADAYESALNLQNYTTFGILAPTTTPNTLNSGWGLQYPTGSLTGVIAPSVSVPSIPLEWIPKDTSTNKIKLELLRMTFGIGFIDGDGRENWADTLNMYVGGGYLFSKAKISGTPSIKEIQPTRVYPELGATYANGAISVNNVEQGVYDSSYVVGVSDPDDRRGLWFAGNLLWQKHKIKTPYPTKLGDISGIKNEADAVQYIKNQYALAGVTLSGGVATLSRRYTATFTVSQKYIWEAIAADGEFQVGSAVRFSYPHIASGDTAVVTAYTPNPITGKSSITLECVGDTIATNEEYNIIESGAQADNIPESGAQPNNYVEEI